MNIPQDHLGWFTRFKKSAEYQTFAEKPIAYFCAEYALEAALPTYAGGLGVLSGDFIREAAARDFPLIAVGLYYQKAQSLLTDAENKKVPKLEAVLDAEGQPVLVSLPIEERTVSVRAWRWRDGSSEAFFLDTDIPENDPRDRGITHNLYDEARDIRLKQEIILGIGGFRILARLGYHASVYHLNEGHSAMLALELVRHEMEHQRVDFAEACDFAKKHILFTNHTLVPEGQEQFSAELVARFMERYAREMKISGAQIAQLGSGDSNPTVFSMTTFSFRFSSKHNAVSRFHTESAGKIWPGAITESVTNGVFVPRWDKIGTAGADIWTKHLDNKRKLLAQVAKATGKIWQETDLLLVWARRLVEYKQPLLLMEQADRLRAIIDQSPVPVRIIFSGPTGGEIENPFEIKIKEILAAKLAATAVFLPNFSLEVAEILTAGADVWLNTPLPGTEACGTSGMKAGLNGALALSTLDGWVHEINAEDIGWVARRGGADELLSLIEHDIVPLYHAHLQNPKNSVWLAKMQKARGFILENFSTTRVLREYIEKLYLPILQQKHTHRTN